MPAWVILFFVAIATAAVSIFLLVRASERRRTEMLRQVAETLHWSPLVAAASLPAAAKGFPLLSFGRARTSNLTTGTLDGIAVQLFDYSYVRNSGKSNHRQSFTVAFFPDVAKRVPDFELKPEGVIAKVGQLFGYQDIDFPEDEEFSKRYLLRGSDEPAIRAAFGSELRSLLLGNAHWRVESRGGAVVVTRTDGRFKPQDVSQRLAEARRIVRALAD